MTIDDEELRRILTRRANRPEARAAVTLLQSQKADTDLASLLLKYRRRVLPPLTQGVLATKAGISLPYYQRLEKGRASNPSLEIVLRIGWALGLDQTDLDHLLDCAKQARPDTSAHDPAETREMRRGNLQAAGFASDEAGEAVLVVGPAAAPELRQELDDLAKQVRATIEVVAADRVGLLADITQAIRKEGININVSYGRKIGDKFWCIFDLGQLGDGPWHRLRRAIGDAIPGARVTQLSRG